MITVAPGGSADDLRGGGDAVRARHPDVHHHHVGRVAGGLGDRLGAGGCLADHLDAVLDAQQGPQAGPDKRLVVGYQHPDCHPVPAGPGSPGTGSVTLTSKPGDAPGGPARNVPPCAVTRSRSPRSP